MQLGPQATNSLLHQRTADNLGIADYALRGGHKELLRWLLQQDPTLVPNRAAPAQNPQSTNAVPVQRQTTPLTNKPIPTPSRNNKVPLYLPRHLDQSGPDTLGTWAQSRLSPNIAEILASPCPIWPGKTVGETHKLVLVPATVNGTHR